MPRLSPAPFPASRSCSTTPACRIGAIPDYALSWRRGMRALAERPNVAAKISGLAMFDHDWTADSIRPFVLDTIEIFGTARCMFASNFPVDKLHGDYDAIWNAFDRLTADFSDAERRALFHDNAARFYRLGG